MRLTRVALENFRSYAAAELHLDPGLTIVAGPNGAGKTNLLEAIFVAIAGRRNRANTDAEGRFGWSLTISCSNAVHRSPRRVLPRKTA